MSDRVALRNEYGRIIGYTETDSSGRKVLKDSTFRILGYYDPRKNITMNDTFRVVGKGDILTSLLRP